MAQQIDLRQAIRDNVWLHFYQMHRATDPNQAPIIVRGEGANVWDSNGKQYVDGIELVRDRESNAPMTGENLVGWLSDELLRRGVICRADDRLEPVIQLSPPLNIPKEDIDFVVDTIAEVVDAMARRV